MLLNWIKKRVVFIIITILFLLLIIFMIHNTFKENNEEQSTQIKQEEIISLSTEEKKEEIIEYYVDIKGEVVKPGVYKCDEKCIVNDIISLAGGLTKNASTENINLSKKIINEMVIVIYSKSEIKKMKEQKTNQVTTTESTNQTTYNEVIKNDAKIDTDNSETVINSNSDNISEQTTKVNINTADINALTTLPGVGESKAQSIIDYRNTNGNYKNIEDIMNVSGIKESLYEKIKDYITI